MPRKATRAAGRASNAYTCSSAALDRPSARAEQCVANLQRTAPNKEKLVAAFQLWCGRRGYGDADAAYVLAALLQLGLKPEDTVGESSSNGVLPTTILQNCLFSPILLQQIYTSGNLTASDLNRKQPGGSTLLHAVCVCTKIAANTARGIHKKTAVDDLLSSCKLLLELGADPKIPDSFGMSVLDAAWQSAALAQDDRAIELVIMIGQHTSGGCLDAKAIRRALKHAPGILISKLRRLAADATPLSIHTRADDTYDATGAAATSVAAAPDSPAEGAAAANGRPGAGDATWGFKQLPDEQFEQASLLLWAAEWKLATFNQILKLIPLACIPNFAGDMAAAASNVASNIADLQESENEDCEAGSDTLDNDLVAEWLSALSANPWQLGLYAMANSIKQLQTILCLNPKTLSTAAQGIKALIAYAQHLTIQHSSNTCAGSSTSTEQVFLPSKQAVPKFVKIADSVATLVSWTIVAHGNVVAEDNQALLEPLAETGYHKDLLTLLGMGYLQAGRGLAGITWIPTVAVDILELLAANNGDNVFTKQMTTAIRQVIKSANKGHIEECKHLQEALWCAKIVMKCNFILFVSVYHTYYQSDRAAIPPLLGKAMPLIARLHGTRLAAALSAAGDLTLNQLHCSAGASKEQVKLLTHEWKQFNCLSRKATQGLEFAAELMANLGSDGCSDGCNVTGIATCSEAISSRSDGHGGAEASSSTCKPEWGGDQQDDPSLPSYLFTGIKRCHAFLVSEVSREMGVEQSHLDMFTELTPTCGMVEACRTLQLAAGIDPLMGRLAGHFRRSQMIQLAKQDGDTAANLDSDRLQRRAARHDQNCWSCGLSAEEAGSAGRLGLPSVSGRERLLTCGRCKLAKYCCVKCQKSHWKKIHKHECTAVSTGECMSPAEFAASEQAAVRQQIEGLTRSLQMDFAVGASALRYITGPAKTD